MRYRLVASVVRLVIMQGSFVHSDESPDIDGIFNFDSMAWPGHGGYSSQWGYVNTVNLPWVYSFRTSWVYLSPDATPEAYWIWVQNLGWLFSSADRFPSAYSEKTKSWILWDLTDPIRFKYFDTQSREWSAVSKPSFTNWDYFKAVPAELLGFKSVSVHPAGFSGSGCEIGSYYLREWYGDHRVSEERAYFYNPDDGWFYPLCSWSMGRINMIGTDHFRYRVQRDGDNLIIDSEDFIFGSQ